MMKLTKSDHKRFVHAYRRPSLGSVRYAHEKRRCQATVRIAHATRNVPRNVPMSCGLI